MCQRLCPPYKTVHYVESKKKIGPCLRLWARGSPSFLSSVSLEIEGDGAPTGRSARITPGGVSGLLRTVGRETSRPAPCGAPTRHLGLYAFDRGRTGPAPSGRRGCPSTARGRRLRLPPARRCRSRSPPYRTPPVDAPRRVDRDMANIGYFHPKHKHYFSPVVNDVCVKRANLAYALT